MSEPIQPYRLDQARFGNLDTRGSVVEFLFNGQVVQACVGESLAAALFSMNVRSLRLSPRNRDSRGLFCMMGSCQECAVWIDGRRSLACQEPVIANLDVRSDNAVSP